MSLFDDDRPQKPLAHEIGSDLSLLSVDELSNRIELLQAEIIRLEEERKGSPPAGRRRRTCFAPDGQALKAIAIPSSDRLRAQKLTGLKILAQSFVYH